MDEQAGFNRAFEYSVNSEKGARAQNEDSYASYTEGGHGLFVVADGLGGLPGGEYASYYFCQALVSHYPNYAPLVHQNPDDGVSQLFQASTKTMLNHLLDAKEPEGRTTAAAVILSPQQTIAAHIGDSRIYHVHEHNVSWRSRDHSYAQYLFEQGVITESQMAHHPTQTQLLRSLGHDEDPEPDIKLLPPLSSSDSFLLCTDGFWEHTSDGDIVRLLDADNLDEALNAQVGQVLHAAGASCDNVTAQAIRVRNSARVNSVAEKLNISI